MKIRIYLVCLLSILFAVFYITCIHHDITEAKCLKNDSNISYCSISGNIESLYINDSGLVVVKFKTEVSKEDAKKEGFIIKDGTRAVFEMDKSVSKFKLDMLKSAYLQNRAVTVHAHDVHKDYLLIGHIWLK